MSPTLYADLIAELRALFTELDQRPEPFQSFDVHLELAVAGSVLVYETKRSKGETDSLYYGRSARTGETRPISQAAAFTAIDRFFGLGEFVALADRPKDDAAPDENHPHCAVRFAYRRKGEARARSLQMIFIGFSTADDALAYRAATDQALVMARPHFADWAHEWR